MAQQVINVGTIADDHTGDKLRAAFVKANADFTELYSLLAGSPMVGTKYAVLKAAVKNYIINSQKHVDLYYIGKIICGTGSGPYLYRIEIYKASDPTTPGTLWSLWQLTSETILADWQKMTMGAIPEVSYCYGAIVIDWDQLTLGSTYICSNFKEGGIGNPGSTQEADGGAVQDGGLGSELYERLPLPVFTEDFTADGSLPVYIVNSAEPVTCIISPSADLKGAMQFINIGTGLLTLESDEAFEIDGSDTVIVSPGENCEIMPDFEKFTLKGKVLIRPGKNLFEGIIEDTTLADAVLAGNKLESISLSNTSNNEVTVKLDTVPGGSDLAEVILAAYEVADVELNKTFSRTDDSSLYISSTDWNGASIDIFLDINKRFQKLILV